MNKVTKSDLYNKVCFIVIMITGFCSLGYQVVWQKYLSVLVGSEARSSTIIIAIFLTGLSIGYYLFGIVSKRINSRNKLLKIYGFVELVTGGYAIIFSRLFELINNSTLANSNSIIIQISLTSMPFISV